MKIILSRKGFDSENGGQPSPILPDDTLLSLPIPSKVDTVKYSEIYHNGKSYYQIIKELKSTTKIKEEYTCHLDPDIRYEIIEREKGWKGLFGQVNSAQGHLKRQNVSVGDLFIYFGWFKKTELVNKTYRYIEDSPDIHVIYGYLQIGNIYITSNQLPYYATKHPHATRYIIRNNCIYEASDQLSPNNKLKGYGCLKFNDDLVLTKKGHSRSHWDLPDIFKEIKMSYHTAESFKSDYFNSANKGQEFVLEANQRLVDYFMEKIESNVDHDNNTRSAIKNT